MIRYYKGMVTGLAVGMLGTAVLAASVDPKLCSRAMRKGRCLVKGCKRKMDDWIEQMF